MNAVVELLGGIGVLLYPRILLLGANLTTESVAISKLYALSILVIGIVSYQCFKYFEKENTFFRMIFLAISTYHLLIGFQLYGYYNIDLMNSIGPVILHLTLAILCMGVYLKESK